VGSRSGTGVWQRGRGWVLFQVAVADERLLIEPIEVLQFLVLEPNSRAWEDMSEYRGVGSGLESGPRFGYTCIGVRFSSSSPFLCKPTDGAICDSPTSEHINLSLLAITSTNSH
jgi:hypothetical protein